MQNACVGLAEIHRPQGGGDGKAYVRMYTPLFINRSLANFDLWSFKIVSGRETNV
jgi:hypothetical protein